MLGATDVLKQGGQLLYVFADGLTAGPANVSSAYVVCGSKAGNFVFDKTTPQYSELYLSRGSLLTGTVTARVVPPVGTLLPCA